MGIPIDCPTFTYRNNLSVIQNMSKPESTIKKKNNYVCYHKLHESVAMGKILCSHEASMDNPADIATKVLPGGAQQEKLVGMILYDY